MVWSEHFATGIDAIDAQHRELIEMINAAAPLLAETGEVAAREVQPLLEHLTAYAKTHFSAEEALMKARGVDPRYCSHHRDTHAAFTAEVALMRDEAMANDNVSGNDLLRFLIGWLSFHILAEDKQFARQIQEIENGKSAATAYAEISHGDRPAMTVLTDAMIDMFGQLTTQNMELAALNRELNATKADLNQLVESTLNMVWNEIKYKAEVSRELGELPLVDCLPSQINQVLINILVNATHAIESKGRITLRTGVEGKNAWIEIADTGKGMSQDVRRRIFEPFYTTKAVGAGTGLGLSISWDIIERHGGSLEVESAPGVGTTFRIKLPIKRVGASGSD